MISFYSHIGTMPIASRETGFYVRAAYDLMRIGHFYKAKSFE